jgi:hypothetical protein
MSAAPPRRSWATTSHPRSAVGPCTIATLLSISTFAPILFSSGTSVYRPSKIVSRM